MSKFLKIHFHFFRKKKNCYDGVGHNLKNKHKNILKILIEFNEKFKPEVEIEKKLKYEHLKLTLFKI
jgi:hypothetical protein